MEYLNANLAREVNRLHGCTGPLWERRYQAIVVTDEEEAQVGRLRYLLSQSVKENLVSKVKHWPGLHFGKILLEDRKDFLTAWGWFFGEYRDAADELQKGNRDARFPEGCFPPGLSDEKSDFAIPSKEDPSILIEAKAYGATGSKQTDILGDIERIVAEKRDDTTLLLVLDGVSWKQRSPPAVFPP